MKTTGISTDAYSKFPEESFMKLVLNISLCKYKLIKGLRYWQWISILFCFLAIYGRSKDKSSIYTNFWNVLEWAVGVAGWFISKIYTKSL